jgi:hypothetical protein
MDDLAAAEREWAPTPLALGRELGVVYGEDDEVASAASL